MVFVVLIFFLVGPLENTFDLNRWANFLSLALIQTALISGSSGFLWRGTFLA